MCHNTMQQPWISMQQSTWHLFNNDIMMSVSDIIQLDFYNSFQHNMLPQQKFIKTIH